MTRAKKHTPSSENRGENAPRRLGVPAILGVAIAFGIALGIAGGLFLSSIDISSLIFERRQEGGSQSVLLSKRDLDELETLAYVRRTVFPHDYLLPNLTIYSLTARIAESNGAPEEVLSPEEYRHYTAANLATEIGLATRRDQTSYVVVTTEYRWGYRIAEISRYLTRNEEGVSIGDLPPAQILSITTEDIDPEVYPYGPVPLDPEEWKTVAAFVRETEIPEAERDRLEQRSRENTISFLETSLAR